MGYVFNYNDAINYEKWFNENRNSNAFQLEVKLLLDILKPSPGETIIDIGCGIGAFIEPMIEKGLDVTGIDPSPYMLDIAKKKIKNKVDLHKGFSEDLPFEDNSFNHACLITTLEFSENPEKAIEEACRVAKDKLFIGVLNKYALISVHRRIKGIVSKSIYNRARFFSIWELKRIIYSLMGNVPISWKTVNISPKLPGKIIDNIEQLDFIQKTPFGAFMGIVVTLVPRYRTKPLTLKYKSKLKSVQKPVTDMQGLKIKFNYKNI